MEVLRTENLKKYYDQSQIPVKAVDGIDISVEQGEFVAIVGTSGSGKSTLLNMLGGLDRPTEGTVFVDGKDIFSLKDEELTIFRRRKIGFVFQAYNLVPVLNVYENIVLPIQLDGNEVDKDHIDEIISVLGLSEVSSRGSRSQERLQQSLRSYLLMNLQEISILKPVRMCSAL